MIANAISLSPAYATCVCVGVCVCVWVCTCAWAWKGQVFRVIPLHRICPFKGQRETYKANNVKCTSGLKYNF